MPSLAGMKYVLCDLCRESKKYVKYAKMFHAIYNINFYRSEKFEGQYKYSA